MTWLLLSLIPCVTSFNWCQNYLPDNTSTKIQIEQTQEIEKNFTNTKEKCIQNPKIDTFMYHYIRNHDKTDNAILKSLSVPPDIFEEQMQTISELKNSGKIGLMTGEDFLKSLKTNCFPHEKIFIFTADDGWQDNFYTLAPIAEKYEIPFIFGIVSGNTKMQNFVTEDEIKTLSDNPLFTIASHSITHAPLNYWPIHKAKSEICDSKKHLEKITWKTVDFFIYPYGKIGNNSIQFAKECGYQAAWSTDFWKFLNWKNPNFFNMNRINILPQFWWNFFKKRAE